MLTPGERAGYGRRWYGGLGVPDGWDACGRLKEGHTWSTWYTRLSPCRYKKFKAQAIRTQPPAEWINYTYKRPPPTPAPPADWRHTETELTWPSVDTEVQYYTDDWQRIEK